MTLTEDPKMRMWVRLGVSYVVISLLLFLSAGTLSYWQAWFYLCLALVSSIPVTLCIINDPVLLANRTKSGPAAEKRPFQKAIVLCAGVAVVAAFMVAGLDRRFAWSNMPLWLSLAGGLLILLGMWIVYRVFRENSFGSATVEIREDQTVISTGPYAFVRNPMYSGAAAYFIGASFALGSYWSLIPSVLTTLVLVVRLFDEEKFLAENLAGYTDYCARVRSHLIPGVL